MPLKPFYKEIVIGTGPSATGYLAGVKLSRKNSNDMLILTSNMLDIEAEKPHPKLCKDGSCIVDTGALDSGVPGATSAHGGLSNAWGGVLVELNIEKIKNSYGCDSLVASKIYDHYSTIINEISHDRPIRSREGVHVIDCQKKYGWEHGELSVVPTIERLASEVGAEIRSGIRVQLLLENRIEPGWILTCVKDTGEVFVLRCNYLVLAAGTVANSLLSNAKGYEADIVDHLPPQVACISLSLAKDINLKTPIVNINSGEKYIATEYRLRKLSKKFLVNYYGPLGGSFVYHLSRLLPISVWQIWDKSTSVLIQELGGKIYKDSAFQNIKRLFRVMRFKAIPFYLSQTRPGEGFHYISPNFSTKRLHKATDLSSTLKILGGSTMKNLPIEHPSLTFMAHAAWIGSEKC